jgi:predicted RecA/RadA family phage recombinase
MQNFIQPGDTMNFTAPAGGVVSGNGYKVGQLFVVATRDVAAGSRFQGATGGVFDLPKAGGAWTEGALVYWDDTAKNCTLTSTSNLLIGCAAEATSSTTGRVRLNGHARANG